MCRAVTLYRSDLDHIIEMLQAAAGSAPQDWLGIEDDEHLFDSLSEWRSYEGRRGKELSLMGVNSVCLTLRLGFNMIPVKLVSINGDGGEAFHKIRELLLRRRRMVGHWLAAGIVILAAAVLLLAASPEAISLTVVAAVIGIVASYRMLVPNAIDKIDRKDTWWSRNWDQLVVGVLNTALSAALGVLVTLAFQRSALGDSQTKDVPVAVAQQD